MINFHQQTPFELMRDLTTPRLKLRKLAMRDAADVYAYCRDPEVARHVLWDAHTSIGESKAYIRYMLKKYRAGEPSSWGIELRSTGKVIGTIGYMWWQSENNSAEVGYSLARPYWNQGLMTEALAAVLGYSFESLALHRVEAQHELLNPASGAVMKKAGMQYEGTLRGRIYNKGRFVDVAIYAMLKEDWMKR